MGAPYNNNTFTFSGHLHAQKGALALSFTLSGVLSPVCCPVQRILQLTLDIYWIIASPSLCSSSALPYSTDLTSSGEHDYFRADLHAMALEDYAPPLPLTTAAVQSTPASDPSPVSEREGPK